MNSIFALIVLIITISAVSADVPDIWKQGKPANRHEHIRLTIALKYRPEGISLLKEKFEDITDPKSTNYGKYMTREEISTVLGPERDSIAAVENWLAQFLNVKLDQADSGAFIVAEMSAGVAEKALNVKLYEYTNNKGHRIIRSPIQYTLPEELERHIDLITGATDFPVIERLDNNRQVNKPVPDATGQPISQLIFTSSTQMFAQFTPRCANGEFLRSPKLPLCGGSGPSIVSFSFTLQSETDAVPSIRTIDAKPPYVVCQLQGEAVTCTAIIEPVGTFRLYEVSVATVFSNGEKSPSTAYGFKVQVTAELTPKRLRQHYNIPESASIVAHPKNSQAVAEFGGQYYTPEGLEEFARLMGMPPPNVKLIGPNNGSLPGDEATLDIQYLMGMAPSLQTTFWSNPIGDFVIEWAMAVNNATNPPLVHSVSYGTTERALKLYYPPGYMDRCDQEFMKMGLKGLSVMFAAGDAGAGNYGDASPTCDPLHPNYPTSSPYVTSVGATVLTTMINDACRVGLVFGLTRTTCTAIGEMSVSGNLGTFWTSGGGFSDRIGRQKWQDQVVSEWFAQTPPDILPPASVWNPNGRGYPDVAAIGHNLMIYLSGMWMSVDGTSASTPIFSGVVSLLNNIRLYNNKPPLGYLNPLLYQLFSENPSNFNDVTFGTNRCGCYKPPVYSELCRCPYGFNSTVGWDPTSGLGTPNYALLSQKINNLN